MTKIIRESNKEGIHLTLSRFLLVCMGCPVFILQIGMLTQKCETGFRTQAAITYWLMKTWPGIILPQQRHYRIVLLTYGFLQRSTLKLKTFY